MTTTLRSLLLTFAFLSPAAVVKADGPKPFYVCSLYQKPVYLALAAHAPLGKWDVSGWRTIVPHGCQKIMVSSFNLRWSLRSAPNATGSYNYFGVDSPIWFRVVEGQFSTQEIPGLPNASNAAMAPFTATTVENGTAGSPTPDPYQLAIMPNGSTMNSSAQVVLHLAP